MMGESSEMNPILLARYHLCSLSLLDVVHLHRLVVRGRNQEVASVVEI